MSVGLRGESRKITQKIMVADFYGLAINRFCNEREFDEFRIMQAVCQKIGGTVPFDFINYFDL